MPGMMKTDMFSIINVEKMANGLDSRPVARLIQFIIDVIHLVML